MLYTIYYILYYNRSRGSRRCCERGIGEKRMQDTDELVARMTRPSIEALKEFYRDEMQKDDWRLVVELKTKLEKFTGEPI